jgi:hypothetical protein
MAERVNYYFINHVFSCSVPCFLMFSVLTPLISSKATSLYRFYLRFSLNIILLLTCPLKRFMVTFSPNIIILLTCPLKRFIEVTTSCATAIRSSLNSILEVLQIRVTRIARNRVEKETVLAAQVNTLVGKK